MATFTPMSLPPGAAAGPDGMGLNMAATGQPMGIDSFEPDLGFDEALLESVNGLQPLPFTPSYDFETFSTTFEDPFSYSTTRPYEAVPDPESFNEEASAPELDNKLLGFSTPLIKTTVVDETGQFAEMNMSAELFGMFFVAEDVYNAETTGRPLELTCYRRNLWQCSGQITLPRHIAHHISEQGRQIPIFELAASITAIESIEGKPTEIISIPWKSSNPNNAGPGGGGGGGEEAKVAGAPPTLPLDLGAGQELDDGRVSVPVSWKRLQFKHATANNGRRKGLQQHYVVQINLLGKTAKGPGGGGETIKIAEIQSGPVIVRGRSPRNFDSRKDVPLSSSGGGGAVDKKQLERRSMSTDAGTPVPKGQQQQQQQQLDRSELAQNLGRYHSLGNVQSAHQCRKQTASAAAGDWSSSPGYAQSPHPSKKVALSPSMTRPPVPAWSSDVPVSAIKQQQQALASPLKAMPGSSNKMAVVVGPTQHPINLSLSEDERSPNNRIGGGGADALSPQQQLGKGLPAHGVTESPVETDDMLYEYFPLSVDDWMTPVEAIYRPHVVHHTIVTPEVKAQQVRSKTKRYFAAE